MTPESAENTPRAGWPPALKTALWLVLLAGLCLYARTRPPWSLGELARALLDNPLTPLVSVPLAVLASVGLAVAVWLGFRSTRGEGKTVLIVPDAVFAGLLCATCFLWRWPFLSFFELNVDESQDIAAAITLLHDPRYWYSADTMTHGPLISQVLLLPTLLGMVPEYGSARLVGLGLMTGCLLLLWRILTRFFPVNLARLLVVPGVLAVSFCTQAEYLAYNGEHMILFLTLLVGYFGTRARFTEDVAQARWLYFVAGLCVGLTPYAKFQGIPLALIVGLCTLLPASLPVTRTVIRGAATRLLPFAVGGIVPSLVAAVYTAAIGIPGYFLQGFIGWTLLYATAGKASLLADTNRGPVHSLTWPVPHIGEELTGPWLAVSVLLGGILLAYCVGLSGRRELLILSGSGLLVFAGAYFIVVKPERDFEHYLLLLQLPACFLNATLWGTLLHFARNEGREQLGRAALVTFVVLNAVAPVALEINARLLCGKYLNEPILRLTYNEKSHITYRDMHNWGEKEARIVADLIRHYTGPQDAIIVWGWVPKLHVLSGRRQGYRDAILARVITPSGYRDDYFLNVFLADMDRNRPALFADAVYPNGFLYQDRSRFAPECFAGVAERLRRDYVYVRTVGNVRFYLRRDRVVRRLP